MKKKSYIINFALILSLTILALWFALRENFHDVMQILSNLKWYWFIAIFLYGAAYNCIIGWIYMLLGRKNKANYTYKEGLQNAFVGAFFSGITPSATGGQFAQAYVLKNQGIKLSDGASILWIDFIIYQSVMVAYTTVLMILRFNYYYTEHSSFFFLVLIGYIVNSAVIVFLFTMAFFPKVYQKLSVWIVALLGKLKIVKDPTKVTNAWNVQLQSFTQEIKKIKHMKKMIFQCVILNVVRLTVLYTLPLFIAFALGLETSWGMLLDIITMSAFVSVANAFFPVPGASGGTEAAFMLIFSTMFASAATNSIMILWRFATYHLIILIGGLVFVVLKNRYDRNKPHEITKEDYQEEEEV